MRARACPRHESAVGFRQYAIRFAFGGAVVALAGLMANWFGPVVGGLFLGFPSILPAILTLVELHGGKEAAVDDAIGAAVGSIGLLGFAAIVWALASRVAAWQLLLVASLGWLVISIGLWAAVGRARGGGRHAQENECETTTQVR